MDVFKSRFSAFFLLFCKNFFQTVVIDCILLRMQASKQTKERFERTNERTNERNASKCNFLAKRPFHCFHSCFYLGSASSQDIEPFLLLSFVHFLFLSFFLSFCLLPRLQLKSESTFSFGSHVRDVCLIGSPLSKFYLKSNV